MTPATDLFHRALAALSCGDVDRAEQLTRELLGQDSSNAEAWAILANIYKEGGHFERAIGPATRATELEPDNIQHLNNLGFLYLLLGRWEEGRECYARAASMPEAPPTIYVNYAWALIELGQEEAATQQLRRAHELSLESGVTQMVQEDPRYQKLVPILETIT
jgi:Tfp pilus assembly protein PilF